jgi:branched-chain amino acid aminotransferase
VAGRNRAGSDKRGNKEMSLKFEIRSPTNATPDKERAAKLVDPGFGRIFSDHMAVVQYSQG